MSIREKKSFVGSEFDVSLLVCTFLRLSLKDVI
jgi:hypothetical protein